VTTLTLYTNTTPAKDSAQQSSSGTVVIGPSALTVYTGYPYSGIRFENVTIAAGATVSSATVAVYGYNSSHNGPPAGTMKGVKQVNPGVFTTGTSSVSTLYSSYPTTNTAALGGTLSESAYVTIATVTAIITELIGQGSWASGNAMAFVTNNTNSSITVWESASAASNWEQLSITYTAASGYTVTFDNNGGSGSLTAETNSSATALSLFSTGTMALAAFHFVGWNTVANGTGTAYADGATYAFSASATLYAQWAPDAGIVPILM
jgi:hypothetical protein